MIIASFIWISFGTISVTFVYNSIDTPTEFAAFLSASYIVILFIVIAVGRFARVRMLLFMMIFYCIFVIIRSVYGVFISTFIFKMPKSLWFYIMDFMAMPFNGLRYISQSLTSFFVDEIYWCMTFCISVIILLVSMISDMTVAQINSDLKNMRSGKYDD